MTITSQNIPGRGGQTPQQVAAAARIKSQAPELDDSIVAQPLQSPDSDGIVLKDKSMELRWVNYSVGEKESSLRFHQMKAAGYIVVRPDDIENGLSIAYETSDGKIINGDVILMMIPKKIIQAAKKFSWEKAMRRRGRANAASAARDVFAGDLKGPANQLRKISTFVPGQAELDALVGSDRDGK